MHTPRFGQGLKPGADVHGVPEEIAVSNHHVTQMHADAESEAARFGVAITCFWRVCLHRTLNGINDARELGQNAVPCRVRNASAMFGNDPVHDLAVGRHSSVPVILAHEARITGHVRREDRGQTPFHAPV